MSHTPAGPQGGLRGVLGLPARALRWCSAWWQGAGVQIRSTIAAAVMLALVIVIGGFALVAGLRYTVDSRIDAANIATIEGLEALVDADLPTLDFNIAADSDGRFGPGDVRRAIESAGQRNMVVQVLNEQGQVVASRRDWVEAPPLFFPADLPAVGETQVRERWLRHDVDRYRFTLHTDSIDGRPYTVVVGQSLGPGQRTVDTAIVGLAVFGPILLLSVAGATYGFIGRSLGPVTRIRKSVERITHRDLAERVPVPLGRDEVAQLARTMNEMLARLDRATQAQRQFVSDASHELRSPIATLRAGADIALAMPDRVSPQELAQLVRNETVRLEGLVADLLLLARLDERGKPGQLGTPAAQAETDVDLDDLLTSEALRLRASTLLQVDVHRQPVRVTGHPDELARMLRNLTDNAARHAQATVGLSLRRSGRQAVLEVSNDGVPIAVADRQRVFERFVRLEESRARDLGGSGLGLAIVREIVTAHGGTVEIVDPSGSSGRATPMATCFQVRLPAQDEDDAEPRIVEFRPASDTEADGPAALPGNPVPALPPSRR